MRLTRIIEILREFAREVEISNPHNLVLKGGTALSLYYLDHHRESEDLDFDVELNLKEKIREIEDYIVRILKKIKEKGVINDYKISKKGFASTDRYHMKLEFITHKTFHSKLDIDFVELPKKLKKVDQLNLYLPERIFISKIITFINRQELKDLYDVRLLIKHVDSKIFKNNKNVTKLIEKFVEITQTEELEKEFKIALRNTDLRFKHLKEAGIKNFIDKTKNEVLVFRNKIRK